MMNKALNLSTVFFKPLFLLAVLTGCSVNPATGQNQFTALMSPQQEMQVGASEHEKIMQTMGDQNIPPEVKAMVSGIGGKLAVHTERPDIQYKFFVLDSPMVNAFALPGGYVYVTRGLLALANSEAELAAVLAHEIGHITGRHSAERYSRGVVTSLGAAVIAAALDNSMATQALGVGSDLYTKSYSRAQEHESDALGVRYLQRAGYDPMAMAAFLQNLQRNESLATGGGGGQANPLQNYFSTHPQTADRIAQAQALAQQEAATATTAITQGEGRGAYINALSGLIYGDSPQHGFVRGTTFYHPEMNFTFTAPDGFALENQSTQVIARNNSGAAMIFDAATNPQNLDPAAYISRVWLKDAQGAGQQNIPVQHVTMDGKTGAMATLSGTVGGQTSIIRVIAVQWTPDMLFRFQLATPQNAPANLADAMQRAAFSLRPLTAQEKRDVQPLRLRAVTAKGGDTVASLAAQMAYEDRKEDRFRVLNGLNAGQQVVAGQQYKIVSPR